MGFWTSEGYTVDIEHKSSMKHTLLNVTQIYLCFDVLKSHLDVAVSPLLLPSLIFLLTQ